MRLEELVSRVFANRLLTGPNGKLCVCLLENFNQSFSVSADVEGCCWWGRGSLSIKGTCLYGKLNYHIGKNKSDRDGRNTAMFPNVDFCRDPGQGESIELSYDAFHLPLLMHQPPTTNSLYRAGLDSSPVDYWTLSLDGERSKIVSGRSVGSVKRSDHAKYSATHLKIPSHFTAATLADSSSRTNSRDM